MKGCDTNQDVTRFLPGLQQLGVEFVPRYLRRNPQHNRWGVKPAEVKAICAHGMWMLSVFEFKEGFTDPDKDAGAACEHAAWIGQPKGTGIYHAVDHDVTARDLSALGRHFDVVAKRTRDAGWSPRVYGDDDAILFLHDRGLIDGKGWLSNAKFWSRGGRDAPVVDASLPAGGWFDVVQTSTPVTAVPGLQVDWDWARDPHSAGLWRLGMTAAPKPDTGSGLIDLIVGLLQGLFGKPAQ